jgi:quercetin dioxygenase-like cupin family protein
LPLVYDPKASRTHKQGEGWKLVTLADYANAESVALVVRRWSLQAGARTPETPHEESEEMLYVVQGSGYALVGEQYFELSAESMLWLEPGDSYRLIAGNEGLEVLQGYAAGNSVQPC